MTTLHFDARLSDEQRRAALYAGDIFLYSPTPATREFCDFAQEMASEAFSPHDPRTAQHHLSVETYVAILAKLKPAFIHHPRSKRLIRQLFQELGCDDDATYFDVPRLRTMTHGDYLTAGLAYAFHPHRDTWFSAPPCQINWWIPVFDICEENTMALHPRYWSEPLPNSSHKYNYYLWNKYSRHAAAAQVRIETREQPRATVAIDPCSAQRIVCPAGGLWLFSAAHLHSTVPNTSGITRFSIDFRTVHVDDVAQERGAPNIDSACTGTTLADFLRGNDGLTQLPSELIALYDSEAAFSDELAHSPAG